ncbi:MAG: hypothetical protein ACE5HE_11720 [Phycisphaerae bacterium]
MTIRMFGAVLAMTVVIGVYLGPVAAQDEHGTHERAAQTSTLRCPVSDDAASFAWNVATADGPLFFCCKDCIPKYQADPSKYAEKAAAQRKALAGRDKVQVTCPISHKPVAPDAFIESNEQKVHFCCKGCIRKYQQDTEKYRAALANSFTYQTKCPVMGGEISPQAFTTLASGAKVYFCCPKCEKALYAEPEKFASKLTAQGMIVKPGELKPAEQEEQE